MDTVLILGLVAVGWYILSHASAQAQASATPQPLPSGTTAQTLQQQSATPAGTTAQTLQQQAIAEQYPGPIPTPTIMAGAITTVVPLTGEPSPPLSSGSLDYYFTETNPAPAVGAYSTTLNFLFNALQVYGQHQAHSVDEWNTYLYQAYRIPAPDPPILSGSMDLNTYWTTMESWVRSYLDNPDSVSYHHEPALVPTAPLPAVPATAASFFGGRGFGMQGWIT